MWGCSCVPIYGDATQRNATQRNATQCNTVQRNAIPRMRALQCAQARAHRMSLSFMLMIRWSIAAAPQPPLKAASPNTLSVVVTATFTNLLNYHNKCYDDDHGDDCCNSSKDSKNDIQNDIYSN